MSVARTPQAPPLGRVFRTVDKQKSAVLALEQLLSKLKLSYFIALSALSGFLLLTVSASACGRHPCDCRLVGTQHHLTCEQ